jgi:hypothetical protein
MKTNWIKRGAPVMALLFLAAFGMISCSTDPVSSPDTQSSNLSFQSEETTPISSPMSGTDEAIIMTGHLRMDPSGECWYFIVSPFEVYELRMGLRLREQNNGQDAMILGTPLETIQPRCSSYEVLKVKRINLL